MHFAICIWGLMRSLNYTIKSYETYILKALEDYGRHTYDVYVHTYYFKGSYDNLRNGEHRIKINFSDWKLLTPNYIYSEDQDSFDSSINYDLFTSKGDPWDNDLKSLKNHIRYLNALNHLTYAVESASRSRHYDGIVFVRPDVEFMMPLPVFILDSLPQLDTFFDSKNIMTSQKEVSQGHIFIPDFHRSCKGGQYNDRMALTDLKGGLLYGKRMIVALHFSTERKLLAEAFTYEFLQSRRVRYFFNETETVIKNEIKNLMAMLTNRPQKHSELQSIDGGSLSVNVFEIPFRFRRIRANGKIHSRDLAIVGTAEEDEMERSGTSYSGGAPRTHWVLRLLYVFLEYITFDQVYIWNHDDESNILCSPHVNRISHHTMAAVELYYFKRKLNATKSMLRSSSPVKAVRRREGAGIVPPNDPPSSGQSKITITCKYTNITQTLSGEPNKFASNEASFVIPYDCKNAV